MLGKQIVSIGSEAKTRQANSQEVNLWIPQFYCGAYKQAQNKSNLDFYAFPSNFFVVRGKFIEYKEKIKKLFIFYQLTLLDMTISRWTGSRTS